MEEVMIDLETMDTKSTTVIVSIGAAKFEAGAGVSDTFYQLCDIDDQISGGRTVSGSTIRWWMKQNEGARLEMARDHNPTLREVLDDFSQWLGHKPVVWGNGATFDISILEDAYDWLGLKAPWPYYNVRDMRTITALGAADKAEVPSVGDAHNAVDDAVWQAKYVSLALSRLGTKARTLL